MSVRPGQVSIGSKGGASGTAILSVSMSSGRAITTGPGRPLLAVWNARETISGTRAESSISLAHFAKAPNTARQSSSWNASRSLLSRATWPTNMIIGVES